VFVTTTRELEAAGTPLDPGEDVIVRVQALNSLGAGRYHAGCWVHNGRRVVTYRRRVCDFAVHGPDELGGMVVLDHSVELDRRLAEARR
jgi:hypothetical protein